MKSSALLALAFLSLIACKTDDEATTDSARQIADAATGTVGGHTFAFAHGIAFPREVGGGAAGYEILLSDKPIDCDAVTLEGASTVDLDIAGTPPAAKKYEIVRVFEVSATAEQAEADFNAFDASCKTIASDGSLSGEVTLTKSDGKTIEGTIDVTFETNARVEDGKVKGAFTATVCPSTTSTGSLKKTCTPT